MELICPSCTARYRIPDDAIGENGRQVSCANCGHRWRAWPPPTLDDPAPARADPDLVVAAPRVFAARAETNDHMTSSAGRSEQLAEISRMLAEVQSEVQSQAQSEVHTEDGTRGAGHSPIGEAVAGSRQPEPRDAGDATLVVDEQKVGASEAASADDTAGPAGESTAERHADPPDRLARGIAYERPPAGTSAVHRARRRRKPRRRDTGIAGSGAFLAGFLPVVIVAAALVALYELQPTIVERMPGTERTMTAYVNGVDSIRLSITDALGSIGDWIDEPLPSRPGQADAPSRDG